MLIEWFLSIKSLPNLLFGVLCLPGDRSHPVAQPTINPLACCICWARLLGHAVFPPWNKGPNSGSYKALPRREIASTRSSVWNWVPIKLSSPVEFTTNLSIQNVILFFAPPMLPPQWRNIKEKEGLKPSRTLRSPPEYQSSSVSLLSCLQKKALVSQTFPEFQWAGSSS